jgi:hypothetical protein
MSLPQRADFQGGITILMIVLRASCSYQFLTEKTNIPPWVEGYLGWKRVVLTKCGLYLSALTRRRPPENSPGNGQICECIDQTKGPPKIEHHLDLALGHASCLRAGTG